MADLSAAEVIEYVTTLEADYSVFRTETERATMLAMMNLIPDLPEDFIREDQINILSGDVLDAVKSIRSQVLQFPTAFSCLPTQREGGGGILESHKRKADQVEKADAMWWTRINAHRRLDRRTIWRQLIQPLAIVIIECGPITSPNPSENFPWRAYDIPLDACGWLEEDDIPTRFGRRYRQVIESIIQQYSGQIGTEFERTDLIWENGKWGWAPISEGFSPNLERSRTPAHGWEMAEIDWYATDTHWWACAMNSSRYNEARFNIGPLGVGRSSKRTGEVIAHGENPMGRCPAFIIPSGEDTPLSLPADKYLPGLVALMANIEQRNVVNTMRATKSRNRAAPRTVMPMDPNVIEAYMKLHGGQLPPALPVLEGGSVPYTYAKPELMPVDDDPDMALLEGTLKEDAVRLRPPTNAQLSDPQVLGNATAAGIIAMIGANDAALSPLISANDSFKHQAIVGFHNSVKWYAKQGKRYGRFDLSLGGSDDVTTKGLRPGDRVPFDPDTLDFPHEIRVRTQSRTTAQTQALIGVAAENIQLGVGTYADLYEAAGITDQHAQEIQQAIEMATSMAAPQWQAYADLAVKAEFLLDEGIDLNAIALLMGPNQALLSGGTVQPAGTTGGPTNSGGQGNHTTAPATEPVAGGSTAPLAPAPAPR